MTKNAVYTVLWTEQKQHRVWELLNYHKALKNKTPNVNLSCKKNQRVLNLILLQLKLSCIFVVSWVLFLVHDLNMLFIT